LSRPVYLSVEGTKLVLLTRKDRDDEAYVIHNLLLSVERPETERSYIYAGVVTTVEETTAEEHHAVAGVVGLSIPPALAPK
jgi:hypothetical protein